jgi:hypothetical protein
VAVDDFTSYAVGPVDTVTANWKGIASPALAEIRVDPLDAANKVLGVTESTNNNGVYGILSGSAIIPNGATKTLFLRILTPISSAAAPNTAFGLIDLDVPPANCWASISTFVRINNGAIQARNGSAANWGPARPVAANTWYNVWIVTNHASKTFDLYVNEGSGAATAADKVGGVYAFRASHSNDLDRFVTQAQGSTQILFDDIYVADGADLRYPKLPVTAHNPVPADGATGVSLSTTLSWYTGVDPSNPAAPNPAITKHYVYFKMGDPNFAGRAPQQITASGNPTDSCAPPFALALDSTYYWRVDESVKNSLPTDPNTLRGAVWSFETQRSIPTITQQPAHRSVFVSETAQFTVLFTSVSVPTVVWKKYVDGVNDQTLSTAGTISITTSGPVGTGYTTTLQIANTNDGDQARYYCLLTNGPAPAVQSGYANLVIKKMLAHYAFENNFNDSVGINHGAGMSNDANYAAPGFVSGIAGNRAVLLNGISQYVSLSTSAFPNGGLGGGMAAGTISCWVKATQAGVLYSNYNDNLTTTGLTGFGLSLTAGVASNARIHVRGQTLAGQPMDVGAAEGRSSAGSTMIDGQWRHVAATWQSGGQLIMYVNGVRVSAATAGNPETFASWERSSVIGAIRTAADRTLLGTFYGGALDDLRVYNYVLDNYAVADLYHAATGLSACIEPYASMFDYNGNCVVDLGDFAAMAGQWLDCGLYPECP